LGLVQKEEVEKKLNNNSSKLGFSSALLLMVYENQLGERDRGWG
jgi:hypothetical protein